MEGWTCPVCKFGVRPTEDRCPCRFDQMAGSFKIAYFTLAGDTTTAYVHLEAVGTNKHTEEPIRALWSETDKKWREIHGQTD